MTTTWGAQIPKPPPDEAKVVALSERALKLNQLAEHPSWPELRQVMEERRDVHATRLSRKILSGNVDQREIDRHAGFWAGVFAVLDKPQEVETQLQKMLSKLDTVTDAQEGA